MRPNYSKQSLTRQRGKVMELTALPNLLCAKDVDLNWSCLRVDNEDCFYCIMIMPLGAFLFCLVPPLNKDPYLAVLDPEELKEQCRNQGFLEGSIDQIRASLCHLVSNPSSALRLQRKDNKIELSVSLSSALTIFLKIPVMGTDARTSSIIVRRLLDDVLSGGYLLERLSSSRVKMLDCKDKAIEFLKENLEELGDKQVLDRWAPEGSMNYQALGKYDDDKIKRAVFAKADEVGSSAEAQIADLLFTLRRELMHYKKTNPRSPSKSRATKLPSDFTPTTEHDETSRNQNGRTNGGSGKLEETPSLVKEESPITKESPSPGREKTSSPGKKRKFRRFKITK